MRYPLPLLLLPLAVSAPALALENVPVPEFQSIEIHGGGEILLRKGPVQRVTLAEGSSQFTNIRVLSHGRLRIDACNSSCPQLYHLRIVIDTPSVPILAVEGGGKIATDGGFGSQQQLVVAVDGGGRIDASNVPAQVATAAVHGGGEIRVRSVRTLTAAVNGGGLVRYWGDPAVTTVIQGGGAVQRGQ